VERAVRARIAREAARRGLAVQVDGVRVGPWPPLRLTGVRVAKPGAFSAAMDQVDVRLRFWGRGLLGRARLGLAAVALEGPAGLRLDAVPTTWDVEAVSPAGLRLTLREPTGGLSAAWIPNGDGARLEADANGLAAGPVFSLQREGLPLLEAGTISGTLRVALDKGSTRFELDAAGSGLRLASLAEDFPVGETFGPPTSGALRLRGAWLPAERTLRLTEWRAALDGAVVTGTLSVADLGRAPRITLVLDAERVDFARLFRASGLADADTPAAAAGDLGSAALSLRVQGRLDDAASFTVSQKLDFTPPRRLPAAIQRLRGDFLHEAAQTGGGRQLVSVSAGSPDFIPLSEVPPLFVRTLLLGEDAGFFGHPGIDLRELPAAILTNVTRGGAARGASTITQQLAKNLFLSREKRLGRKLQELALALLLESALSKERILEIYLNVIEWGPGLHGLRPAARRYFGVEPSGLTPAQTAFLVALIPGPVKYQSSFARGEVSPRFRPLVDSLLAKLRSVNALSEEEYQAALAEELVVNAGP
jgi:penicillin-binding protein 1A